jgi:hypothetical protein
VRTNQGTGNPYAVTSISIREYAVLKIVKHNATETTAATGRITGVVLNAHRCTGRTYLHQNTMAFLPIQQFSYPGSFEMRRDAQP